MQLDPTEPELSFDRETCMRLLKMRVGIEVTNYEYEEILRDCAKYLVPQTN